MTRSSPTTRKPTLDRVLEVLEGLYGRPVTAERPDDPLVDHLLVGVLGTLVPPEAARAGIRALSEVFLDFNEARSSPLSELEEVLGPHVGAEHRRGAAAVVRMALQDVWDGTHGLDLEPLRGREPEDQRHFVRDFPNTPGGPAALVFQVALGDKQLALGPRERHLLTRFGMLPRASTPQRVRQAMERRIKPEARYRFAWLTGAGSHAGEGEAWDPSHPICSLLISIRAKEVVEREKEERREEQRRKAEERRRAAEEVRRKREEERARKIREREAEKRRRIEARKAEEARRREEARKKAEARRAEAAQKKAALAAKRAAAAAQKAQAQAKKAQAKKAQAKKAQAKKAQAKKKSASAAKSASKKTAAKKPAAKKGAARKGASKKAAPKKATTRKAPARRKAPAKKK